MGLFGGAFDPPHLAHRALAEAASGRWDGRSVFDVGGPYGDYLLDKVARVFPELFDRVVRGDPAPPGPPGTECS